SEQAQTDSKIKAKPKFNQGDGFVQDMQKGLQLSDHALN
ncbi:MAG TPA: hydrolase or metal-binding protein, partial [Sphingobacterium sp.]|nr:hydrolase or metal-binding protein [Sphingobacterium sp.]